MSVLNEKTENNDPAIERLLAELDNSTNETGKEAANDPCHGDSGYLTADEINDLKFVDSELKPFDKKSTDQIIQLLKEICESHSSEVAEAYPEVRQQYLEAHMELNLRFANGEAGAMAPFFRSRLKYQYIVKGYEKQLSNDSQVIDLNLLHRFGFDRAKNRYADAALNGKQFNFDEALKFAASAGKASFKADELLCIDESIQLQLITFKSEQIRKVGKMLADKKISFRNNLRSNRLKMKYIKGNEDDWADISVAALLCMQMKLSNDVKPSELRECFRIVTGRIDLKPQVLKKKLDRARKYLPELEKLMS